MDADLARQDALEAERISASAPVRARQLATAARRAAQVAGDDLTLALAERALGLAARELNELALARRHLRRSISVAERAGRADVAVMSRVRLAYVMSLSGQTEASLHQLEEAARWAKGVDRAQLRIQRALVLQRAGRIEAALSEYRLAIPAFRRGGRALEEAQSLSNRAVLHTYRGDFAAAQADLRRAEGLAPQAGEGFAKAKIHHNLGFVAARRGNIPEALGWFDLAQTEFEQLGLSLAPLLSDRCETLLSVGLAVEGLDCALRAVTLLEQNGPSLDLAEACLMAAQAGLLLGDTGIATVQAKRSRTEFRRQGRGGWAALADYVLARARLIRRPGQAPAGLEDIASSLTAAGWLLPAIELRLAWAKNALAQGRELEALSQLQLVARGRRRRPVQLRAHGWHAEALIRLRRGDVAGSRAALRTGLRVLDQHYASLGATELRVHAASRSEELATLGCEIALASMRAPSVFEWAERWRAGALRRKPVRPPPGREIDLLLGELRHVTAAMEAAALEGRATQALLQRQSSLEELVRDRTRQRHGAAIDAFAPPLLAELRGALGDAALIEYVAIDDRLYAVTVTAARTRLFALASMRQVIAEVDSLRFSYSRLARGRGSSQALHTFLSAAEHASGRLDELLISPLTKEIGERRLVIVPTGRLHHLPWAGLPSCASRTLSVAPSAAMWLRASNSPRSRRAGRVVLIAGPGVAHAEEEIEALMGVYPGAQVLLGKNATVQNVTQALDGAHIAHVAAHGSFRSDNPQFSSIQLADGNLTVYDLELLRRSPRLLVLSACESGLNAVRPGDELLGLAAAVLSLGTANLMASVVPVPDQTTADLMVAVHRGLVDGEGPPTALAHARRAVGVSSNNALVTTSGFVCFGA